MTAPLPSRVLEYLSEPRTEAQIYARFAPSAHSEVLDVLLYLAGRREIMIDPQSNGKRWTTTATAKAHSVQREDDDRAPSRPGRGYAAHLDHVQAHRRPRRP